MELRQARKEQAHEPMLARIAKWSAERADALEKSLAKLEEREARGWMDALARGYELALLAEAGESEALERSQAERHLSGIEVLGSSRAPARTNRRTISESGPQRQMGLICTAAALICCGRNHTMCRWISRGVLRAAIEFS